MSLSTILGRLVNGENVKDSEIRDAVHHYFFENRFEDSPSHWFTGFFDPEQTFSQEIRFRVEEQFGAVLRECTKRFCDEEPTPEAMASLRFGLGEMFVVCIARKLLTLKDYFLLELQGFASSPLRGHAHVWQENHLSKWILMACAAQVPATEEALSIMPWRILLHKPVYTTLGLIGLGTAFVERLPNVVTWWGICDTEHRGKVLQSIVRKGTREIGKEKAIGLLLSLENLDPEMERLLREMV